MSREFRHTVIASFGAPTDAAAVRATRSSDLKVLHVCSSARAGRRTSHSKHQDFDPLPFDAASARAFGRVAAGLRRAGRKTQARAYDALIAAI